MAAAPQNLGDLRQAVDELVGVEFTDSDERDRALNEGNVELCTRSGWTRDTLDFGPAVADQTYYSLPATFRKPADYVLTAGNVDYPPADPLAVRQSRTTSFQRVVPGVWWIDAQAGERVLGVDPIPAVGTSLLMLSVVTPDPLTDPADEPPVPWDFRMALVYHAAKIGLMGPEDDAEMWTHYDAMFSREADRLTMLRQEIETGDGPVQVQIAGVHYAY